MPTPHPDGRGAVPYTRADAIADALLFEVPPMLSRQFRFTYPVAVTAVAWFDAVAWDVQAEASKPRPTHQCEAGRITDVLWAARHAVDARGRCPSPRVAEVGGTGAASRAHPSERRRWVARGRRPCIPRLRRP